MVVKSLPGVNSTVQPSASTTTRVLVADPNASVRSSLRLFVESEPGLEFVGAASDSHWLLSELNSTNPDVLVLDCSLPGANLECVLRTVRLQRPTTRVVMLGSGPWQEPKAREAGADTFVSKVEPPDVLRAALRSLDDRQN
jgi:DNA-binding NarL/FixJ family response regulator